MGTAEAEQELWAREMSMEHVSIRGNQATWILDWFETVSLKTQQQEQQTCIVSQWDACTCASLHSEMTSQSCLLWVMPNGCCKVAAAGRCELKAKVGFRTHLEPKEQREVYRHCPDLVCIVCNVTCTLEISQILYLNTQVFHLRRRTYGWSISIWNGMFTDLLLKGVADRNTDFTGLKKKGGGL